MALQGNCQSESPTGPRWVAGVINKPTPQTPFGLSLNGPGLLIFGGTGTWSGDTRVNPGTLQIDASGLLPAANEYVGTGSTTATVVQNSGNNVVSANGSLQGLIIGYGSGNAYYNLNGGLLNSANEFISSSGIRIHTDRRTNQAGYLSMGTFYNGNYYLSGGLVTANIEDINDSALNGAVRAVERAQPGRHQSERRLPPRRVVRRVRGRSFRGQCLRRLRQQWRGLPVGRKLVDFRRVLPRNQQSQYGSYYYLSNSGLLTATNEYIGYSGTGTLNQSGGTNSLPAGNLYLGFYPGSSGTYTLSGGVLDPVTEYVGNGRAGNGGVGIFYQSGGPNTVTNVSVNGGYFLLSGGQLLGNGSGTIGVVNGGFQSPGTLDLSGCAAVVAGTGAQSRPVGKHLEYQRRVVVRRQRFTPDRAAGLRLDNLRELFQPGNVAHFGLDFERLVRHRFRQLGNNRRSGQLPREASLPPPAAGSISITAWPSRIPAKPAWARGWSSSTTPTFRA